MATVAGDSWSSRICLSRIGVVAVLTDGRLDDTIEVVRDVLMLLFLCLRNQSNPQFVIRRSHVVSEG